MSGDAKPEVELDFERDFCARHIEPFRDHWPAGAGIALVELFGEFAAKAAELAPRDDAGQADAHALQALVLECAPLCCYVGDEAMGRIYAKASEAAGLDIRPPG